MRSKKSVQKMAVPSWKDSVAEDEYFRSGWTLGKLMARIHEFQRYIYNPGVIKEASEYKPAADKLDWYERNLKQMYRALDHIHAGLVKREELRRGLEGLSEALKDGN